MLGAGAVVADDARVEAVGDLALYAVEGARADEEDVLRVHLDHGLIGVLAATLRGDVDDGALQELEQPLLDALAADVACDGGIVPLAGDLVDLVDEDDAALGRRHVVVGDLQQARQQALDVLTDVAGLRQYGGVYDGEGYLQEAGDGLR